MYLRFNERTLTLVEGEGVDGGGGNYNFSRLSSRSEKFEEAHCVEKIGSYIWTVNSSSYIYSP